MTDWPSRGASVPPPDTAVAVPPRVYYHRRRLLRVFVDTCISQWHTFHSWIISTRVQTLNRSSRLRRDASGKSTGKADASKCVGVDGSSPIIACHKVSTYTTSDCNSWRLQAYLAVTCIVEPCPGSIRGTDKISRSRIGSRGKVACNL